MSPKRSAGTATGNEASGPRMIGSWAATADRPDDRIGSTLARFPGTAHRTPQGLVHGFAGEPDAVVERLHQDLARRLAAGHGRRERPEHGRLLVPAGGIASLHGVLQVGPVETA